MFMGTTSFGAAVGEDVDDLDRLEGPESDRRPDDEQPPKKQSG